MDNSDDKIELLKQFGDKALSSVYSLFPYAGIKQKTVAMYIDEIQKSNQRKPWNLNGFFK